MQKVYSKKASITVFLTLLLLLSASFFFALLETARLKGLGTKADIVSDAALESVFAVSLILFQDLHAAAFRI